MGTEQTGLPTDPAKPTDDQILLHIVERLGQPGWTPEDIAFLINHPEYDYRPVGIREFIQSPLYMNATKDCWPAVLDDLEEIFAREVTDLKLSDFSEIIRKMGYGSGKGFRITFAFCYVLYRLQCFKDPQRAYGQAAGSTIALVNAAVTADHAKKIIFGDISERIARSPWFQSNCRPDPDIKSELRFPKNIVIFPGSSSEVAPIGYNIFFFALDEAAFLKETDVRDAARTIYETGRKRIKSRFGDNGIAAAISSPSHVDNFIEHKFDEGTKDKAISSKEGPTWANKPADIEAIARGEYFELQHPRTRELIKIPLVYKKDFDKDPRGSWRDFGAVASMALEPFFSEEEIQAFELAMKRGRNVVSLSEVDLIRGAVYHAHIDLGLVRDACGLVVGREDNERLVVVLALRIVSRRRALELEKKNQRYDMIIGESEVEIEKVRQIIYDMIDMGFTFGMVSMDGFQSVDTRQQFEKKGIPASIVSVDRDTSGYDTIKSLLTTNRLETVSHDHVLREARSLELKKGKKVDHAPGATKDVMDGYAGIAKTIFGKYDEVDEVDETFIEDEGIPVTGEI